MYNKVIMIGNLTKDPELRYTPQGTPVCSFRIAVNNRIKKGDRAENDTLFIGVVTFGKQAETASKYLSKGSGVLVEGRLQERRWESGGQQKSLMEIVSRELKFMPRRDGSGGTAAHTDEIPPEETADLEPF
jgi:single-strand DNA-binding protein